MKRALLIGLLVAGCSKEVPVSRQAPSPSPAAARHPLPAARGEGGRADWTKVVDLVRVSPRFQFEITLGDIKASGELVRTRVGEEKVRFTSGGAEWRAERHMTGVTWFRNGVREANEPAYVDRIDQWITLFPDPEKSAPQVVGTEGELTHIRFTNLNTSETNDAWIRRADNHLVRLKTSGAGTAFPAVEISIHE